MRSNIREPMAVPWGDVAIKSICSGYHIDAPFPRHSRGLICVAPTGANMIENLIPLWAAPAVQHS
jgi:3-methyladenine DNA glycosylase/8-oxoguanine DNA glycosylase